MERRVLQMLNQWGQVKGGRVAPACGYNCNDCDYTPCLSYWNNRLEIIQAVVHFVHDTD